jgi:glycosyltransferase involved in cell wall biosynthesis
VPKLLFVVNSCRYFVQHRLGLSIEAMNRGYKVAVATVIDDVDYLKDIQKYKIEVFPLDMSRRGVGITDNLNTIKELSKVIEDFKPDLIHSLTIKSVILSGIVAQKFGVPMIALIPGRGVAFSMKGIRGWLLNRMAKFLYRISLKNKNTIACFENEEDREFFIQHKIITPEKSRRLWGSGVDTDKFFFCPNARVNKNITVMMACRLLKDKGVYEYIEAAKVVLKKFPEVNFQLFGGPDLGNPTSLSFKEAENACFKAGVKYFGHVKDIPKHLAECDIFCLPTYYNEGIPVSILEASAMGKPVITTSIPGCRDAVVVGKTGLLIEPRSKDELAKAIIKLLEDSSLRSAMGSSGRALIENKFALPLIVEEYLKLYESLAPVASDIREAA